MMVRLMDMMNKKSMSSNLGSHSISTSIYVLISGSDKKLVWIELGFFDPHLDLSNGKNEIVTLR